MPRGRNKKKVGDAAEASKQSPGGTKTPKALKPEAKIAKKSPNHSLSNAKESQKVQGKPKTKNGDKNQEKNTANKGSESNKEKFGGMIFLCNGRTKPDCFRYMVMGFPQSKKRIVTSIKPGLKLFLYDFDAKLLYGIYKASSAGGMNLEPAAFNGSYPSQVRFVVHRDCLPLSEAVFKKAIMGNNAGKLMFNSKLTVQQVKKLTGLFHPSAQLQSNANALAHNPQPVPIPIPLAPLMPIIPAMEAPFLPHPEILARSLDELRRKKETPTTQREAVPGDPLSLSEKEYRTYGLKREPPKPVPAPLPAAPSDLDLTPGNRDPYYAYRIAPDQYALPPRRAAYLTEVHYQTDLSRTRIHEPKYNLWPAAQQLATNPTYHLSHSYGKPRSEAEYGVREAEAERLHSTHAANAANALSDYNRRHQQSAGGDDLGSLPVSSRYSFAGPELSYR